MRPQEHLTGLVTSVTTQQVLFNMWLYLSRGFTQPCHEPKVWLVYTMSTDSSKLVTTVSKPQKWHAEILQWALREPSLQPAAGLAMPAGALHQWDRLARKLHDPSWQIYAVLRWAIATHQLGCLPWVYLGFCSWLCHGSSLPSKWKTSSRTGEGRTTAQ